MDFLEKDLEDIIEKAPQDALFDRGLTHLRYSKLYRQVPLLSYGTADIITVCEEVSGEEGVSRMLEITIYELKQNKVDVGTLLQAAKYLAAVRQLVDAIREKCDISRTEFTYKVVLIGKTVDLNSNFIYLADLAPYEFSVYTYSYGFDGIHFKRERGYHMTGCDLSPKAEGYIADWKGMLSRRRRAAHLERNKSQAVLTKDNDDLPF